MSRGEWQPRVLAACAGQPADRHESGRSAAGSWRMQKVASSHGPSRELSFAEAPGRSGKLGINDTH